VTLARAAAFASAVASAIALSAMVSTPMRAQENPRGFIGLDIGPSQPFGSFKDSPGNARSGYTSTLLNVGWRRGQRWGVAGMLSYSEYFMRNDDGVDDDWWQVAFVTIGPMYTVPLSPKAALDIKGTLGFAALTPVIDSRASDSDTGPGLAIDMRATVRYDVFRRLAVFAEGGVQSTSATVGDGVKQQYRALIGGFGVAYRPQWGRDVW
jgi:hypothetical protein